MKGWSYSLTHQDEALQAFLKANPGTDKTYAEVKLPEVLKLTDSPDVRANELGHSTAAGWENLQKQLVDMDIMKEKTDVSKVFSNEFLK
jgi:NitT/TauT family transport system substrate-binding protein